MPRSSPLLHGYDENRSAWTDQPEAYVPLPPLARDLDVDVAIIGGGFTGVSTAWHLARRFPERSIALLEARELANGASGRSGGLLLNWINGVEVRDPDLARRIYGVTSGAIDDLEARIRALGLDRVLRRDGLLEIFTSEARAAAAFEHTERQREAGLPVRWLDPAELKQQLQIEGAFGAVLDPTSGVLDGVGLLRGMRPHLVEAGVLVYEQTPVLSVKEGARCTLELPGATVRAGAIVLATNAYTPALGYFRSSIFPLHSHVIATDPLSPEEWAQRGWRATSGFSDDRDRVAYASLSPSGRLTFGGGSNLAYGYRYGGGTAWPGPATARFAAVEAQFHRYFPALADLPLARRWTGPLGVTLNRVCSMGVRGDHRNVFYALGYSGHGVNLSNLAGRVLADLYAGEHEPWRTLPFHQQRMLPIPPEPLRWAGYHAFTALTGKSPRRRLA